jgi:uncharacterized protein
MLAVKLIVGLLLILGLAGSVVPLLPGTPLIFLGALVYAVATDFTSVGAGRLLILAALAVCAYVVEHAAGALGTKRYGGSRWAMSGAVLGAVVGLFFGPLGLILGPVVGAIAGELIRTGRLEQSVRSGFGALVGMLAGAVGSFAVAVVMVALFLWWAWRG